MPRRELGLAQVGGPSLPTMPRSLHSRSADDAAPWDTEALPQGEAKVTAVRQMFDAIAPRYDMVNRIMTFRLDVRWRRKAVDLLALATGSTVVDLAAGTGDLCADLESAGHLPLAFDLSYGMLAAATVQSPRVQADILRLPLPDGAVDGATCGFALRNLVDLPAFFAELARVVRRGGRIALLDVGVPRNRLVRVGHGIYFGRIVPRVGGWLSDPAAYRYLPRSVAYLPPSDEMVVQLRRAGFGYATHRVFTLGVAQLLTGTRGAPPGPA